MSDCGIPSGTFTTRVSISLILYLYFLLWTYLFFFIQASLDTNNSQDKIHCEQIPSRTCDSTSIPSLSSFLTTTSSLGGPHTCLSSPIIVSRHNSSFSDSESDWRVVDSGVPTTYEAVCADLGEIDEESEVGSYSSDLFSSSPNLSSRRMSDIQGIESGCDFHSIMAFESSVSVLNEIGPERSLVNSSPRKSRRRPKRKISNWYQVK